MKALKYFAYGICAAGIFGMLLEGGENAHAQSSALKVLEDRQYKSADSAATDIVSGDGRWMMHLQSSALGERMAGDRIVLTDTRSGLSRVIFDTAPSGEPTLMDSIELLAFSPNDKEAMFILSGATWYYPRDVMTIGVHGSGLKQLTKATPAKWLANDGGYAVNDAQYSRDGKRILLSIERVAKNDPQGGEVQSAVALIRSDAEKQAAFAIAEGHALFWSADGRSFYYEATDGSTQRFYPSTHTRVGAGPIRGSQLGRVPDHDAVFVETESGQLAIDTLDGKTVDPKTAASAAAIPLHDAAGRKLSSIVPCEGHRVMLRYGPSARDPQVHTQRILFP